MEPSAAHGKRECDQRPLQQLVLAGVVQRGIDELNDAWGGDRNRTGYSDREPAPPVAGQEQRESDNGDDSSSDPQRLDGAPRESRVRFVATAGGTRCAAEAN